MCHNYWACALEHRSCNYWSLCTSESCSTAGEATTTSSPLAALEKKPTQQRRSSTAPQKQMKSDSFKKPSHVFKTEKVQTWIMSGYIVWKRPRCWERLKAGGEGDDRGWDGWMASPTQWIWVEEALGVGDGQGSLACCCPWGHKELNTTERLNWTDIVPRMPNLGPASLVAQMAKNLPQCWRRGSDPWFGKIPWRREWLSTVVFLPGEFHGQRSLVGYTHGVAKSQTRLRD